MSSADHAAATADVVRTGVVAGPTCGLRYQTPTRSGITGERGQFTYVAGETVSFLLGGLVLGSVQGAELVDLARVVPRVDGRIDRLRDPAVTNLARLVQSLDRDGDVEAGVTIAPAVHDLVPAAGIRFEQPEEAFADDPEVIALLARLDESGDAFTARTPRALRTPAAARNELRRNIRGIVKQTDIRIPLRDGSFVYADVFRPAGEGHYPVVLNKGFYGKAFDHACICDDEDAEDKEVLEDRFFSGNPDGLHYENHESVDSSAWVPNGYVCVRVDSRGVGRSPGLQAPFSVQQAEDYADAIEWAGTQPWSNGAVGLWGMSYLAMTQHMVASLQPPHLKAMIAIGTDADLYNEATYSGGLFAEGFWTWWFQAMCSHNFCGERRETDWRARLRSTPFDDPEAYGTRGSIFMRPALDRATTPVWIVGPQTGVTIHQLGSSETFVHSTAATARKFDFVDAWFPASYQQSTIAEHQQFFDHWLKGEDNGAMDGPPVRVQVRTGNGAHHVLHEQEWPIARTSYRRWYLDATPTKWSGDDRHKDLHRIVEGAPETSRRADYEAHLDRGRPIPAPTGYAGGTPRESTGISFVSDPLQEDLTLAGYMKAGLWVSSSSTDMDVFVSLRVIDEDDHEVRYETVVLPIDPAHIHPVGHGLLKVSHRALDATRTTPYWPVHTHAEADCQPLQPGEVVPVEVGLFPSTALVRAGSRLRVDIQPYTPSGIPVRAYDESYHVGAVNTVYTGPDHPSYLQLPVIPPR